MPFEKNQPVNEAIFRGIRGHEFRPRLKMKIRHLIIWLIEWRWYLLPYGQCKHPENPATIRAGSNGNDAGHGHSG
jgi:hypothetical protein